MQNVAIAIKYTECKYLDTGCMPIYNKNYSAVCTIIS